MLSSRRSEWAAGLGCEDGRTEANVGYGMEVGRALLDGAALYAERTEAEDPSRRSAKLGGARRRRGRGRREREKEKGKGKKGFE